MGNCNEVGVCVGETTWTGSHLLSSVPQTGSMIDYGSLMFIALQRSKTAREAIDTMTSLLDKYGYYSKGETFSIVDEQEAWVMDVIGRGPDLIGAVWVARRIPDGYILVHANHAKITTFPLNDPENCVYSKDVISLARKLGLYHGRDADFNFQAAYDGEKNSDDIRYEEARVFDVYSRLSPDPNKFYQKYIDYAMGHNLDNEMPIWIKPKTKVSLEVVIERMGSHYEDSTLEYGFDVGGGLYSAPYRPKPNSWTYENNTYVNERSIAVEKTALCFVSVIRSWMPPPLKTIVWFGADDSSTSPRYPVYACSAAASSNYIGKGPQDGETSPMMRFDWDKAFWIQNLVRVHIFIYEIIDVWKSFN
jgi:dipeptidase